MNKNPADNKLTPCETLKLGQHCVHRSLGDGLITVEIFETSNFCFLQRSFFIIINVQIITAIVSLVSGIPSLKHYKICFKFVSETFLNMNIFYFNSHSAGCVKKYGCHLN